MDTQYKLFFGGAFAFDSRDEDYEIAAAEDYRSQILGSVQALLRPKDMSGVSINDNVFYIGPFYFEAESRKAEDIILCEKKMIEDALRKHHNRRKIVADALGMSERTLYRKIKKYGLE